MYHAKKKAHKPTATPIAAAERCIQTGSGAPDVTGGSAVVVSVQGICVLEGGFVQSLTLTNSVMLVAESPVTSFGVVTVSISDETESDGEDKLLQISATVEFVDELGTCLAAEMGNWLRVIMEAAANAPVDKLPGWVGSLRGFLARIA